MAIGIIHNKVNTNVQGNLSNYSKLKSDSIERISSGNRIIKSSDDVGGLAVGTQLKSNVNVLRSTANNSQQAIAMLSVADAALENIGDMLQRMNSLASQATSSALNDASRSYLNQEFQNLKEEINRIAEGTKFNGKNLLDGSIGKASYFDNPSSIDYHRIYNFINANDRYDEIGYELKMHSDNESTLIEVDNNGFSLRMNKQINGADYGEFQRCNIIYGTDNINDTDNNESKLELIIGNKLFVGGIRNDLTTIFSGDWDKVQAKLTELDVEGGVTDTVITIDNRNNASDLNLTNQIDANRFANMINKAFKNSLSCQTGTSANDKIKIDIADSSAYALGIGKTKIDSIGTEISNAQTIAGVYSRTITFAGTGAIDAVDRVEKAIEFVNHTRADIGSYISRFEKALNTISLSAANQDTARSVYLDADISEESTALAAQEVKINSSLSVMSQSNEMNRNILKLMN